MNPEITAQQLHITAGLLVAVLAVLFVLGKIGSKFLDDWWEKSRGTGQPSVSLNGNGDTKRVCFMAEGVGESIVKQIDDSADHTRTIIHENHAMTITILDRLARAAESQVQSQGILSATLALLTERIGRIEKRLDDA